jgi:hypothetical protein
MYFYFEFSMADNSEKEYVILIYVMHYSKVLLTYKKSYKKKSLQKRRAYYRMANRKVTNNDL